MFTVLTIAKKETIIKKSKFIAFTVPLKEKQEIENILQAIKKTYKGADHYCYAYRFECEKRFQDDGEPSGTAGMPILNVIEKQNLDHILIVVVRYFGGIKLGVGGLVRAYTNAALETLKEANIVTLIKGHDIKLVTAIEKSNRVEQILGSLPFKKIYCEDVHFSFVISSEQYQIKIPLLKTVANIIYDDETWINGE